MNRISPLFAASLERSSLLPKTRLSQIGPQVGVASDQVTFSGTHRVRPKPEVVLGKPFIKVVHSLLEGVHYQVSRRDFSRGIIFASTILDYGASEQDAMTALLYGWSKSPALAPLVKQIAQKLDPGIHDVLQQCENFSQGSLTQTPSISKAALRLLTAEQLFDTSLLGWQTILPSEQKQTGQTGKPLSPEKLNAFEAQLEKLRLLSATTSNPLLKELEIAITDLKEKSKRGVFPDATNTPTENDRIQLSPRFIKGLKMMLKLHRDQVRLDTKAPYTLHLLNVGAFVLAAGGSEDAVIAAMLHDGPEDQGGQKIADKIRFHFGQNVAGMIQDCTQPDVDDWMECKRGYVNHIPDIKNPESLLIIAADKRHNLRTLARRIHETGDQIWSMFWRGKDYQIWFYQAVTQKLEERLGLHPLIKAVKAELQSIKHDAYSIEAKPTAEKFLADHPFYEQLSKVALSIPYSTTMTVAPDGTKTFTVDAERQKLHQRIIESEVKEFLASRPPNPPGRQKIAHMVTGMYAGGKSCLLVNPLAKRDNAYIADTDKIKPQLPGYSVPLDYPGLPTGGNIPVNNGIGATAIHKESSIVNDQILDKIIELGENFVIPHTGSDPAFDIQFLRMLKEKGYKTYIHHVEISPYVAINRANARFHQDGRFIPPRIISALGTRSTDNFLNVKEQAIQEGLIDGYTLLYNGLPTNNEPPVIVESTTKNGLAGPSP